MSRYARIPFDISPSPKVSSLDCNVILTPVAACRTALEAASVFMLSRPWTIAQPIIGSTQCLCRFR
ncbi:protein of unknown function [Aminobacter niigataensis]|nr:protein of unknown function [Aminobacter niigataensis]